MEKKRKDVTSCGCLVYRHNGDSFEVLLVKPFRDREAWGAPKGHIDEGETFEECAKREVLEETGLRVKIGVPLPVCHTKNHHENKTVRIYIATAEDPQQPLVGDGENHDMRWFPIDAFPELHKYQRETIMIGVKMIGGMAPTINT
jgi:8-oxo-dGTP diphosphatase